MDNIQKRLFIKLTSSRFMAFILGSPLLTYLLINNTLTENAYVKLMGILILGLYGSKGLEKLTNLNR